MLELVKIGCVLGKFGLKNTPCTLANALVRSEDLVSAMTGSFELDLGVCRVDLFHNSKAAQVKSPEIG